MTPLRSTALAVAAVAVVVLVTSSLEGWVRTHRGDAGPGTPHWIWDPAAVGESGRPHAFVARRSVRLEAVPPRARALVVGDEEYLLDVNGVWVGGGRYRAAGEWHGYDVTDLLRPGRNRISIELRSSRGTGGLLFCLRSEGRCLVTSDGEWRVVDDGGDGGSVRVWGTAGIGRWPRPRQVEPRRRYDRCLAAGSETRPRRIFRAPWREPTVGTSVWWANWGETVAGAVVVELPGEDPAPSAARFVVGRTVPRVEPRLSSIVPVPGRHDYRFAEPRRLHFVEFVGGDGIAAAVVRPLREGCETLLERSSSPPPGVFGLELGECGRGAARRSC